MRVSRKPRLAQYFRHCTISVSEVNSNVKKWNFQTPACNPCVGVHCVSFKEKEVNLKCYTCKSVKSRYSLARLGRLIGLRPFSQKTCTGGASDSAASQTKQ